MRKIGRFSNGGTTFAALVMAVGFAGALSAQALAGPIIEGDLLKGDTTTYKIKKRETLFDIARKFDLGIIELEAANPGVNPWQPKAGTVITIATSHLLPSVSRDGIVVNLEASRLYYFKSPSDVLTFPIASGKEGWETPVAATKIVEKRLHPTWTIPEDIRAENPDLPESIPPGPQNPLGNYALALGLDGIMIHGTNAPSSIGKHASHGCIRMYPEDIESLFNAVKRGTPVLIAKMPYVLGWQGSKLYLEVTPKVHVLSKKALKPKPDKFLHEAVARAAGNATIDWDAVDMAMAKSDGIPTQIGAKPLFGPLLPMASLPSQHPAPPVTALPVQHASLTIVNDNNVSMR